MTQIHLRGVAYINASHKEDIITKQGIFKHKNRIYENVQRWNNCRKFLFRSMLDYALLWSSQSSGALILSLNIIAVQEIFNQPSLCCVY